MVIKKIEIKRRLKGSKQFKRVKRQTCFFLRQKLEWRLKNQKKKTRTNA